MSRAGIISLFILCFLGFTGIVSSQSSSVYEILYPTNDIQLDFWEPDTNRNGLGLGEYHINEFPDEWGFDYGCPIETRQSYMQFDLSSIPFDIGQARLRIQPTSGWPETTGLYEFLYIVGYTGDWDETVVTYNNPPALTFSEDFDLSPQAHESGMAVFVEDSTNPFDDLGAWLNSNKVENGGSGVVTIGFNSPAFLGCWDGGVEPDRGGFFFSDKESGLPPILEVVPEGENLPDIIFTSVEMSDLSSSAPSNSAVFTVLLTTIMISLLTIGFKKRA